MTDEAESPIVQQLKNKFLANVEANATLYDERDVESVKSHDFFTSRYLNFNNNHMDSAYNQMVESYRWRKSSGINNFTASSFSSAYSEALFPYLPDKDGVPVIHFQLKLCSRLKRDNSEKLMSYTMHLANVVDSRLKKPLSWGLVLNASDVSLADFDANYIFSVLPAFRKYFPNGVKYCIVYGLPWTINFMCKMLVAAMPADSARKIRFYGRQSELFDLIDQSNLPQYLNGKASVEWKKFPDEEYINQIVCSS